MSNIIAHYKPWEWEYIRTEQRRKAFDVPPGVGPRPKSAPVPRKPSLGPSQKKKVAVRSKWKVPLRPRRRSDDFHRGKQSWWYLQRHCPKPSAEVSFHRRNLTQIREAEVKVSRQRTNDVLSRMERDAKTHAIQNQMDARITKEHKLSDSRQLSCRKTFAPVGAGATVHTVAAEARNKSGVGADYKHPSSVPLVGVLPAYLLKRKAAQNSESTARNRGICEHFVRKSWPEGMAPLQRSIVEDTHSVLEQRVAQLEQELLMMPLSANNSGHWYWRRKRLETQIAEAEEALKEFQYPIVFRPYHDPKIALS